MLCAGLGAEGDTGLQAGKVVPHDDSSSATERVSRVESDVRVQAVLEVLGGMPSAVVAERRGIDVALLARWRRTFVEAGAARITNRPDHGDAAERDRYLAAMAHELRTPLTVALGWLDLTRAHDLPPESARGLRQAQRGLHRLAERLDDLELLAAASLGRLDVQPRMVSLRETVRRLSQEEQEAFGLTEEQLATRLYVDPMHYWRIMRDLWQATDLYPAPQERWVEVEARSPWLELRIVRRGDPIPPRLLQSLFDPFEHDVAGSTITIGLYLARALTVAHGGTIGLEQDDERAIFWVRTPLRALDERRSTGSTGPPAPRRGEDHGFRSRLR